VGDPDVEGIVAVSGHPVVARIPAVACAYPFLGFPDVAGDHNFTY